MVHEAQPVDLGALLVGANIHVDLGARTAGTLIAHLPEVVVLVAIDDALGREVLLPEACGLVVALQPIVGCSLEYGHIEAILGQLEYLGQVFPRPVDGLVLEVVPEGPVPQHLEHRVVVGVVAYFLEVVVLAADAQALLRVGHAGVLDLGIPEDDVLELVHPGIGEHQRRVALDHHGSRGHDLVPLAMEELLVRLADFLRSHAALVTHLCI